MCFKIFTVRLTKGLRPACLMEASFSVSAPDGAMVQVLRTRFHLKNEFGNQSCCHPSFNRVCSVFQIVDQESKTEFNVVVAGFFFFPISILICCCGRKTLSKKFWIFTGCPGWNFRGFASQLLSFSVLFFPSARRRVSY